MRWNGHPFRHPPSLKLRRARPGSAGARRSPQGEGGLIANASNRKISMTIDRLFFGYMTLVGVLVGALLIAAPQVGDYFIKPYFWVLIAVGLFEGGVYLVRRTPGPVLSTYARLLGFVIGIVLMVVIPTLAGSPARFF